MSSYPIRTVMEILDDSMDEEFIYLTIPEWYELVKMLDYATHKSSVDMIFNKEVIRLDEKNFTAYRLKRGQFTPEDITTEVFRTSPELLL